MMAKAKRTSRRPKKPVERPTESGLFIAIWTRGDGSVVRIERRLVNGVWVNVAARGQKS